MERLYQKAETQEEQSDEKGAMLTELCKFCAASLRRRNGGNMKIFLALSA